MTSSASSCPQVSCSGSKRRSRVAAMALFMAASTCSTCCYAFGPELLRDVGPARLSRVRTHRMMSSTDEHSTATESPATSIVFETVLNQASKALSTGLATAALSASLLLGISSPALAENELSAKYGGKGFDTSLVDQTCLVDKCSLQAKACLADDPSCRKGLTCTAKCLGDNACITGCMARYGNENLDHLLKCTIEDNECIKVAILDGGADKFSDAPRPPAPTVQNFNLASMEGTWYKVVGFNPNYDCYACQRNTFSAPQNGNELQVDVEFSMPRLLPDGSPPPPENKRESIALSSDGLTLAGSKSIGLNDYSTHETMVFDSANERKPGTDLVMRKESTQEEVSYARTAHSEGEMFGLSKWLSVMRLHCIYSMHILHNIHLSYPIHRPLNSLHWINLFDITEFWENWYIIGENDADQPEFKFVYYNGKTRQNTYEGAFVYSRTRDLDPTAMKKVYQIASDAGMNPDQFCKIRNGCFNDDGTKIHNNKQLDAPIQDLGLPSNPFRGFLASTKVSELLGVESVAAEPAFASFLEAPTSEDGAPQLSKPNRIQSPTASNKRAWWYEVGDYLENPHRHFATMDELRVTMDWPEDVKTPSSSSSQ